MKTRTTTVTAILDNAMRHLNAQLLELESYIGSEEECKANEAAYSIIYRKRNELTWTVNDTLVSMEVR